VILKGMAHGFEGRWTWELRGGSSGVAFDLRSPFLFIIAELGK
jgi:hypothetical protein